MIESHLGIITQRKWRAGCFDKKRASDQKVTGLIPVGSATPATTSKILQESVISEIYHLAYHFGNSCSPPLLTDSSLGLAHIPAADPQRLGRNPRPRLRNLPPLDRFCSTPLGRLPRVNGQFDVSAAPTPGIRSIPIADRTSPSARPFASIRTIRVRAFGRRSSYLIPHNS